MPEPRRDPTPPACGIFLALDIDDHARRQRLIRHRVDHDKSACHAIARIRIEEQRMVRLNRNLADFIQLQPRRANPIERIHVHTEVHAANHAAHLMRRVFDEITPPRLQRLRVHPNAVRAEAPANMGKRRNGNNQIAAADIDFIRQTQRHRLRSIRGFQIAIVRNDARNTRATARRQSHHFLSRTMTDESLPIEYNMTGFWNSGYPTSRMIWMLSTSSRSRWSTGF